MLDQGRHASLTELAAAEKVDRSFLGKLLSLTLLAPDLVEAILEGRCDAGLTTLADGHRHLHEAAVWDEVGAARQFGIVHVIGHGITPGWCWWR